MSDWDGLNRSEELYMITDARIRAIPDEVWQEFEDSAIVRCEQNNEEFLSHTFDMRMCLVCYAISVFSITKSRKWVGENLQIVTRKKCCSCGHNHPTIKVPAFRTGAKSRKSW